VPRRLQERGLELRRVHPELCQDLGRSPTVVDLAERTLLEEDEVRAAMRASSAYAAVSLDAPLDADGARWADRLGTEDARLEDEDRVASFLVKGLRAAGYDVERVARGREALARMREDEPEVVIMDLGLPDLDGSEVIRRYRASAGSVPVIILSARDDVGDRVAGLEMGADDYLCKPFAFDELLARIRVRL